MASWTRNREGQWVVIARESEIMGSQVTVTRKNGEKEIIATGNVSKPFVGKFGEYAGQRCVFVIPSRSISAGYVSRRGAYYDGEEWYRSRGEYLREQED